MFVQDFPGAQGVLVVDTVALANSHVPALSSANPPTTQGNLLLLTMAVPSTQIWPGDFPRPHAAYIQLSTQSTFQMETAPGDVPWPKPAQ